MTHIALSYEMDNEFQDIFVIFISHQISSFEYGSRIKILVTKWKKFIRYTLT